MKVISADNLRTSLAYAPLIDRVDEYFRDGCTVPARHLHRVETGGGTEEAAATLLLMPAWREGGYMGVKIATVFPDNGSRGLASVMASYLLLDGVTGRPLALVDGAELTARRTAAASALASRYLSRPGSKRLLMVGTGTLAPHLVRAHAEVRPISEVVIWGRGAEKAVRLAAQLDGGGLAVTATRDLASAVSDADIVSCATLARDPLVLGQWLRPGQHLDLVGGFRPDMRETDDEAVRRATLFVDTREGALKEAGDIVDPLKRRVIGEDDIRGDLFDLARGRVEGRRSDDEITLFKSVGTALEDLAGAVLAYEGGQA